MKNILKYSIILMISIALNIFLYSEAYCEEGDSQHIGNIIQGSDVANGQPQAGQSQNQLAELTHYNGGAITYNTIGYSVYPDDGFGNADFSAEPIYYSIPVNDTLNAPLTTTVSMFQTAEMFSFLEANNVGGKYDYLINTSQIHLFGIECIKNKNTTNAWQGRIEDSGFLTASDYLFSVQGTVYDLSIPSDVAALLKYNWSHPSDFTVARTDLIIYFKGKGLSAES